MFFLRLKFRDHPTPDPSRSQRWQPQPTNRPLPRPLPRGFSAQVFLGSVSDLVGRRPLVRTFGVATTLPLLAVLLYLTTGLVLVDGEEGFFWAQEAVKRCYACSQT